MHLSGGFEFEGVSDQHFLLSYVSASFVEGFDTLALSVSNNDVDLFAQQFTSAHEATLLCSGYVLNLGCSSQGGRIWGGDPQ